jgi:small subunit ribosomal protein S11
MAKGKIRKNVARAIVHIKSTFNNTMITFTDTEGDTICRDSAGTVGFKGSRIKARHSPLKEQLKNVPTQPNVRAFREVEVRVKGPGGGRESAVSALQSAGLRISSIEDITPIPHNGCRPPKRRRV